MTNWLLIAVQQPVRNDSRMTLMSAGSRVLGDLTLIEHFHEIVRRRSGLFDVYLRLGGIDFRCDSARVATDCGPSQRRLTTHYCGPV
jgi:hypothetical protein